MRADLRILRASEIGEYVFCRRAWWLHRILGFTSANRAQMEAGAARHAAHGRAVHRADAWQTAAGVLFLLAIFFAALFIFAAIFSAG